MTYSKENYNNAQFYMLLNEYLFPLLWKKIAYTMLLVMCLLFITIQFFSRKYLSKKLLENIF